MSKVNWFENVKGISGWALVAFGMAYAIWGLMKAGSANRHKDFDLHDDCAVYVYEHQHGEAVAPKERHAVTPWVMFLIFVLGPCEPMIPLLYFPAAKNFLTGMVLLIVVYTIFTLAAMLVMVVSGYYGSRF